MKVILGIATAALFLTGCAREDNVGYDTGSAPTSEQGTAQTTVSEVPNTAGSTTRLNSMVTTNAGPDTGVGAATAASSGVGTATASGSTAIESEAAVTKDQNQLPPSTPPASSTPQNDIPNP